MNKILSNYYVQLAIMTVMVGSSAILLINFSGIPVGNGFLFLSLTVLLALSSISHFLTSKGIKGRGIDFVNLSLLAIVIKLLFYLIYVLLAFFLLEENVKESLLFFLAIYFIYTVFELTSVVIRISKESNN